MNELHKRQANQQARIVANLECRSVWKTTSLGNDNKKDRLGLALTCVIIICHLWRGMYGRHIRHESELLRHCILGFHAMCDIVSD